MKWLLYLPNLDVKEPELFRLVLYFIYGGKVEDADLNIDRNARDIIDVADKYGIVNLKLLAEEAIHDQLILRLIMAWTIYFTLFWKWI